MDHCLTQGMPMKVKDHVNAKASDSNRIEVDFGQFFSCFDFVNIFCNKHIFDKLEVHFNNHDN